MVTGEALESFPELLLVLCSTAAAAAAALEFPLLLLFPPLPPLLRSGAEPTAPEERGRDPLNEVDSSSAEYVGRTGTIGDRQQTLRRVESEI